MEKEKNEENEEEVKNKEKKGKFDFYKDDLVVEPFMTKTVEKNMLLYILGKVKFPASEQQESSSDRYF